MVNGILLLYHQPLTATAPTVWEHINALPDHSAFAVWPVNTACGFPTALSKLQFRIVVLHYSLFGPPPLFGSWPSGLSARYRRYLGRATGSYKIAFFQDEHHYCRPRFAFLNTFKIDCVYTLLRETYWADVYGKYTTVPKLVYTLTGYISPELLSRASALTTRDDARTIDIGYRARRLPFYMGRGGQEKGDIADGFSARCRGLDLKLDVAVGEETRIYGDGWWGFLANCRGVLGVEAGVSIFDLDDRARLESSRLLKEQPTLTFDEVHRRLLYKWEGNIPYRTISPRHFEAAALRVVQILFEGDYSDVLKASVHYIPLKKDFSNIEEVIAAFRNPDVRRGIAENAYRDLVASGAWTYERFAAGFDDELRRAGFRPEIDSRERGRVSHELGRGAMLLQLRGRLLAMRHARFPGRQALASAARRILQR